MRLERKKRNFKFKIRNPFGPIYDFRERKIERELPPAFAGNIPTGDFLGAEPLILHKAKDPFEFTYQN